MLKSHVKQALSRKSIVLSPHHNDDKDEVRRRRSIVDLDSQNHVKSVLSSANASSKSFRSNSLDDLHKRYVLNTHTVSLSIMMIDI